MEGKAIFVDFDDTLVFNAAWHGGEGVMLRPHARKFLKELRKFKIPLYILTRAPTEYQKSVCSAFGLDKYVDALYGCDQYYKVPKTPKAIMIDDKHMTHPNAQAKITAIGIGKQDPWGFRHTNRYIKVEPWTGEKDDNGLLPLLPEIFKKLTSNDR